MDNRSRCRTNNVLAPSGSLTYTCCVAFVISSGVRVLLPRARSASLAQAWCGRCAMRERRRRAKARRTRSERFVAGLSGLERTAMHGRWVALSLQLGRSFHVIDGPRGCDYVIRSVDVTRNSDTSVSGIEENVLVPSSFTGIV